MILVVDTQAVRLEQAFDPNEKADLDGVAPVISVMGLVDLVDPPHGIQDVENVSSQRYFTPSYFMAIDDCDEGGANALVDVEPFARLDSPEGAGKVASKLRQGGAR